MKNIRKIKIFLILALTVVAMINVTFTAYAVDPASGPTITTFSPADGATVSTAGVTISFTVSDPELIDSYNYYIKVNGVQLNASLQYAGHWEYDYYYDESYYVIDSYDTATISASLIKKSDVNNITVMAQDRLGNPVTKSWSFIYPEKPVIDNMNPPNGQPTSNNSFISARISDSSQVNVASILMNVDGALILPNFDSASGLLTYTPTLPLNDGLHTVQITASDIYGNQATTSWSYTICTKAPQLTFADAGKTFTTTPSRFTIQARSDIKIDSNVTVTLDGQLVPATFEYQGYWYSDSCSNISYYVVTSFNDATVSIPVTALSDGSHQIAITAKDILGNVTLNQWEFVVAEKPLISFIDPIDKSYTLNNTSITAKITDNTQVNASSILMNVDGVAVLPNYDSASGLLTYTPTLPFNDGIHTVQITASDMYGNQSIVSWSYTIKTTGPQLTFTDAGNTLTTASPNLSVLAASTIRLDEKSLAITLDGQPVTGNFNFKGHYEYDSCSGYTYYVIDSYNEGTISLHSAGLQDGKHMLSVTLKDVLGNLTMEQWEINIAEKPVITLTEPPGGITRDSSPAISANITDNSNVDPASVIVEFNNIQVPATFNASNGNVFYQIGEALVDGVYPLIIKASDMNGNATVLNSTITIRTTGPELSFDQAGQQITVCNPTLTVGLKSTVPIDNKGYTMAIDGTIVMASIANVTDNKNAVLTFKPEALSDGSHEISVTAKDVLGNSSTNTWSISVAQPPLVSGLTPANYTSLNTQDVLIKAEVLDPNGPAIDKASIKLLVNNKEVVPSITESGGKLNIEYNFYSTSREATHNVTLTVADSLGNSTTTNWTFLVNVMGEMTINAESCGSCHTLNQYNKWVHTYFWGDCDHCHASYDPNYCAYCHEGTALQNKNCQDCHYSMQHRGISDILPVHSIDKGECNSCHSLYLTREHNRISNAGVQLNCATCHKSSNPQVQQAIADKNKDCTACHGQVDHDTLHNAVLDISCQECHKTLVNQEHTNNGTTTGKNYTCYTCHENSRKDVRWSITNNNLYCSGCHQTAHNIILSGQLPQDISLSTTFLWSSPLEASIFIGDSLIPEGYSEGQLVISNRSNTATVSQEWQYYNTNLTAKGWSLKSTAPGSDSTNFTATFAKEGREVLIRFYDTEKSDLLGQKLAAGYRTELWVK